MTNAIIDTNVAVVANGQNSAVQPQCIDECKKFIAAVLTGGRRLYIDDLGEILSEYIKNINTSKPHQLGAQFLMFIIQNQFKGEHIRLIELNKTGGNFDAFPNDDAQLKLFDKSDRKFAALAVLTGTPVTNAVDSDWIIYQNELLRHGIKSNCLCGCRTDLWFIDQPA